MLTGDHVVLIRVRQGNQGMLRREHVRMQATLVREYISAQGMLTRKARKD